VLEPVRRSVADTSRRFWTWQRTTEDGRQKTMLQSHLFIRGLIVILSVAGLANALYFTFAYYGHVKQARWVPAVLCAREGSSCVTVVQTRYGSMFGVPNSLLGIVYYVVLIAWSLNGGILGPLVVFIFDGRAMPVPLLVLIVVSMGTVILGFYLVYALRRKLHTHCAMCYLGHAINATLLILLAVLLWEQSAPIRRNSERAQVVTGGLALQLF
jgi:uncharacterized membrane protein